MFRLYEAMQMIFKVFIAFFDIFRLKYVWEWIIIFVWKITTMTFQRPEVTKIGVKHVMQHL